MTRSSALCIAALLLLALALPRPVAAQQNALPQDPLQLATEVGRYLFAYDQAANRATTMLLSEGADASGVEASIARQHRDGHWSVGFGRPAADGGFRLLHEVILNDQRLVDEVQVKKNQRLPASSYYARAARAQRLARADFQGEHAPYNLLVLPAGSEAGYLTVYAVPAQTNPEAYRLGGDYRYEVDPSAGEVVRRTPLHDALYEIGALPEGIVGSAHEAVRPVETDVLFATVRRPRAPHFVLAGQQVYEIAPDGTITSMPAGSFARRDEVKVFTGEPMSSSR